ncbi:MAG: hypothetical protein IKX96_04760 [Firmicutes bacterium]|nr:hypothetical protein [Bacillota bacterium]
MIKVYPSVINGSLTAYPSAEHAMKLMFAASIPPTETTIKNVPDCRYVDISIDCLTALGCRIERTREDDGRLTLVVYPFPKTTPVREINFNFRDCAAAAHFITAICAAYGIKANCRAEGSLPRRQQISFTGRLALRGMVFSGFSYPLVMTGRLSGGDFEFRGDQGSQYISALLMALPVLREDSFIRITSPFTERAFLDITLDILKEFGITIEEREDGFFIPGRQRYISPGELECENDWSLASMWTTAAAACASEGGHIVVNGLPGDSHQNYRTASSIFPFLCQDFHEFNIDASEFPNLASIYAGFAVAKGVKLIVTGIPQLKDRETNRLRSMGVCFEAYGVEFQSDDNEFWIKGKEGGKYPANMVLDTQDDPWIFMGIVLASVVAKQPLVIKDEHEADTIYREFLSDFKSLGGKFEIIENRG